MSASRQSRRLGWIVFGLGMIALRVVMVWVPGFAEELYGRGVFPLIRLGMDNSLGLLPFPAVYLLTVLLLFAIVRRLRKRNRNIHSLLRRFTGMGLGLAAFLSALAGLFLVLWGFNYARIPLRHQLALPLDPLEEKAVIHELERAAAGLNKWVEMKPASTKTGLEKRVRAAVKTTLQEMDWPAVGSPRVRTLYPGVVLKAFGVSGVYNPFTGAATLPAGLPAVSRPFLMAHELAHAWGVTDEGEANLVAFLACTRSADAALAYSAHLAWWDYLYGPALRADHDAAVALQKRLDAVVRTDQESLRMHWQRYRGRLMNAARHVNHLYLRSQGVNAGVLSYDSFPALLRAWRRSTAKGVSG